jgi:hypothetical protein
MKTSSFQTLSLQSETGLKGHVTKSRPRMPAMATRTATFATLWILIFMSMFIVAVTLNHSVLTRSATPLVWLMAP